MIYKSILTASLFVLFVLPLVQAQTGQGFTVTSVSLSNILHPGQSASQTQWIVTASLNGGGQSLVSTFTNSTINYQGYTSIYPLQIQATTNPEQAFYMVNNNQPTQIYKFASLIENGTASNFLGGLQSGTNAPACPSSFNGGTYYGEEDFELTSAGITSAHVTYVSARICLYDYLIGTEASISSSPNTQFSSQFVLQANNQQETLNISNVGSQSATSSDGKVQINWVGSLVTGNAAPDGSQYVAISNPNSNVWSLQTLNTYQTYSASAQSATNIKNQGPYDVVEGGNNELPTSCSTLPVNFATSYILEVADCLNNTVQNQFTSVNQQAADLSNGGSTIGGLSSHATTYQNQPAFLVTLPSYFTTINPLVTMRISGSFIGVVIPEGTPKILSATSSQFNSGGNGTIKIEVENIGNSEGSFYPSVSNCTGVTTQSQPNYAVNAGQQQEIDVPIFSTGANVNITEQCTVTITDANGGGSSTAHVTVSMKPANQCTAGQLVVQGDSICSCTNVNGVYQVGTGNACQTCQYGVVYSNGAPKCASSPAPAVNSTNSTSISLPSGNSSQIASLIVNDVVVPVATNFVVPAACSAIGNPLGLCTGILDYLLSNI